MIELEKILALTTKNSCNLRAYWIIKILLVLYIAHIVFQDQKKFIFYINNYIDKDEFNQLYNLD